MSLLPPSLPPLPLSESGPLPQADEAAPFNQEDPEILNCAMIEPAPVYVTVLEDVEANSWDDRAVEEICRPLLELTKGTQIEVIHRHSDQVWVGIVDDRQGAFKLDHRVRPVLGKYVRALYSWTPTPDEGELAFSKGDLIEVGGPHNDWTWWFWGILNGNTGVVPFNYVEPVNVPHTHSGERSNDRIDPSQTVADSFATLSVSELRSEEPAQLKVKTLYDYRGGSFIDLNFKKGDIIVVVRRESDGWWEGTLNSRRGLFPMNFVTFNTTPNDLDEVTAPIPRVHPPWQPYYVRTMYSYLARADDELSFSPGEIIEVYDMAMTPWWAGRRRNGEKGLFPTNFTTRVMDRRTPTSQPHGVSSQT